MRIKKFLVSILLGMMVIISAMPVQAAEVEKEINNFSDTEPYTLYLVDVETTLTKLGAGKLGIRADVYCASVVKKIDITFKLQKKSGSSWVTVATGTASDANVSSTGKSVSISGVSAGTYRAQATAMVTDKYGYSEQLSSVTGSFTIS